MRRRATIVRSLVLVTTVVGLLTGVVGLSIVRDQERRAIVESAETIDLAAADRAAGVVDGRIGALLDQLTLLSTREQLTALDADAASIELQVALRVTEELEELWVLDLDGAPVAAAAAGELLTVEEVAPRSEVDLLLLASGPRARVDRSGPRHVLELSVPVESPPGTADGVLIARADLSRVADEVARPRGDGVRASLVATDGTTLADRDPARVEAEYRHPLADLPAERPVARVVGPEGPTLVAAAPLRTLDGFVVVEQLESALLEEATGLRGPAGVLLVVVIAIVAAVLATAQRLLRPLGPLASAVGRLREGELGARVDESGTGEVADLARGFNAMAVSLEARRRELEDAERDARMSEERLRLVVEGVQDYAIVLLDVLGAVRTWNAGARRVTGCEAGNIIGHRITSLADPTRSVDDPLAEATTTGRGESEGWYLRPDGSRYYGQLTVTTLRRDDGTPYGYAAILQDVTHRQLAQEALEEALRREQEAAAELRSANEVKDEFLNVAAHEIRTPLSAILGASQLLAGGPGVLDEDETEEIQQLIWRHASDMRDIVERLLDFTQLQAGRVHLAPGPLRLRTEFERVVTNVGRLLTDHQVVREAPDVIVEVDQGLLRHVLSNLLSNAAKFSPAGSTVRLTGQVEDGWLTVEVEDEGSGIDPEDHERIFELFRQAEHDAATARGTGVGLAIVRRYVELAGGSVRVDSRRGEGARFTVSLPARLGADTGPAEADRGGRP